MDIVQLFQVQLGGLAGGGGAITFGSLRYHLGHYDQ